MTELTLEAARKIVAAAADKAAQMELNPLTIAVLDASGSIKLLERADGASRMRPDIAVGKANGTIELGIGSRAIFKRAQEQPYFIQSMNALANGSLVPVPGGVLIRGSGGDIIGAVGITGDTSDNDEACAVAGIEAAGFTAETG